MIQQKEITLPQFRRGYHLITSLIVEKLSDLPENDPVYVHTYEGSDDIFTNTGTNEAETEAGNIGAGV